MILTASLVKTSLFLVPMLTVEIPINDFYVKQSSSAECSPQEATRWNPRTATWLIESGYINNEYRLFVGHKSYHAIESMKHLDSYDYVGVEYKREWR